MIFYHENTLKLQTLDSIGDSSSLLIDWILGWSYFRGPYYNFWRDFIFWPFIFLGAQSPDTETFAPEYFRCIA